MDAKKGLIAGVVILVVAGALGYPRFNDFRYFMEVKELGEGTKGIGRFPSVDDLIQFQSDVHAAGQRLGVKDPEITMTLEYRGVGPAVLMFVIVKAKTSAGGFSYERQVETKYDFSDRDTLREAGWAIVGKDGG